MMIKKFLFAAALLSLVLASGCAKGGSGPCVSGCPTVKIDDGGQTVAGLSLSLPMTAIVTGTSQTAVNWTITGSSCTGSGNPCGTLTNVTTSSATYNAPSALPSDNNIVIQAALQANSGIVGSLALTIIPDTADVAPSQLSVGIGLTQQFTAVALPDQAPQTFTWSCMASGVPCVNFTPAPNVSAPGLAVYTPVANEKCNNGCVQISATTTVDPTGCTVDPKITCTIAKTSVVALRLSGTYAFQFSGFDKNGNPLMVAGTFTVAANGSITGVEDELTSAGPNTSIPITNGSYAPNLSDPLNSNNAGTLTLTSGVSPSQFQVVLDGAGNVQMIESDGNGKGSGIAKPTSKNQFNQGTNQTFAFGFTGVDSTGNRVGYVGLMPTNGSGTVSGGSMDVNDNGNITNICGSSPCNVAGSYSYDQNSNVGHLVLTSAVTMGFDLFVANGNTNANSPLTIYGISTDPVDASHPAVVGTFVLQDSSKVPYNNAAFNGSSISALTGPNDNVSLTGGTTDGKGNFAGQFDQNNHGTMISVPPTSKCTPPTVCSFSYTYAASSGNTGRYIFQMLGNPNASPVVPPLPFVLYASGANRGFLLDQSSSAVITGTMTPQVGPKQNFGFFANSAMTGTYAVATNSNTVSTVTPITMNLLLTSPGNAVFNVGGTENGNPANAVTGVYNVQDTGIGIMGLTAPATADYILYGVDGTHFYMIQDASKDTGVVSPILFMAQ